MTRAAVAVLGLLLGVWLLGCGPDSGGQSEPEVGLAVEITPRAVTLEGALVVSLRAGFSGARAGLLEGDRIVAWRRAGGSAESAVVSALNLFRVETEETSAATEVTLLVDRAGEMLSLTMPPGGWGVTVGPALASSVETRLAELRNAGFTKSELSRALDELMTQIAVEAPLAPLDQAWVWSTMADFQDGLEDPQVNQPSGTEMMDMTEVARQLAAESGHRYVAAQLALQRGIVLHRSREYSESDRLLRVALQEFADLAPTDDSDVPISRARSLYFVGQNSLFRGRTDEADLAYRRCLDVLVEHEATLAFAACLDRRGQVAFMRGDFDTAQRLFGQGLELRRALVPGGFEVASSLNGLGVVAARRGEQAAAEELFEQVLDVRSRLLPGSEEVGATLLNLGVIAAARGDLGLAEQRYLDALTIQESLGKDDLQASYPLNNLANLARNRGELERSRDYAERALNIRSRVAPGSRFEATSLIVLANTLEEIGEVAEARTLAERALVIARDQAPQSPLEAMVHGFMGELAADAGELGDAEDAARSTLEIYERVAPRSHQTALARARLAQALARRAALDEALELAQSADRLAEQVAPNTVIQAEVRHTLGEIHRDRGELGEAVAFFEAAVHAIEQQGRRSGNDQRGGDTYRAHYQKLYDSLLDAQLEAADTRAALGTVERGRARALMAMLAARDLVFEDLPKDLDSRYRRLTSAYERLRAQAAAEPTGERGRSLARERSELEAELAEVEAAITRIAPRFAAFTEPEPLSYEAMVDALDSGTTLLSFVVQEDKTRLFVLEAGGDLTVHTIPIGFDSLQDKVSVFRTLVMSGGSRLARASDVFSSARELYDLLISPAAETLARSRRIAISPDGPLHSLPWGALRSTPNSGRVAGPTLREGAATDFETRGEFLAEQLPIHIVTSLSVYQTLKAPRSEIDAQPSSLARHSVVAFADPLQSRRAEAATAGSERTAASAPLPWARLEADALRQLFADRTQVFSGGGASELQVRQLPNQLGILHFATHAFIDGQLPLESGLLLATPQDEDLNLVDVDVSQNDGVLRAWEVLESVRIDTDLVTLSGCDTGLGEVVAGEGVVGLTRAFQYAGARAVLASLWPVADRSTSQLMTSFYQQLERGVAKDEALRLAQREVLASDLDEAGPGLLRRTLDRLWGGSTVDRGQLEHPYHWAGFQLYGDWSGIDTFQAPIPP